MSFPELIILAVGLSMDAFAVAVCKGLALGKAGAREMLIPGAWFGVFQALMPLIGWFLGARFEKYIVSVDHWIAFLLLGGIGFNMLREAWRGGEEAGADEASLRAKVMLPLAVATSIDALAVGITFAFLRVRILPAVRFIGGITFLLSMAGVKAGSLFGARWRRGAETAGGVILILLGLKILLEHLGILPF